MIRVRFEPRGNTGDARHDRVAIVERVAHEHDPKAVHVVTFGPEEWSNLAAAVCRDHETIEATMQRRINESNRASAKLLRDLAARLELDPSPRHRAEQALLQAALAFSHTPSLAHQRWIDEVASDLRAALGETG